jgi:tetratricopeptide (TPR) repeat protein
MAQQALKVFVSSTNRDLFAHRQAVHDAISRLKLHPVGMEHFGAQDGDATEVSLKETTACDLFVGIYAYRYGYRPGGGTSVTEKEYREAVRRNIPRFLFVVDRTPKGFKAWTNLDKHRETDPDSIQLLDDFIREIGEIRVWDTFTSPDDLAAKVATALGNWLREHPAEGWHTPAPPLIDASRRFVGRAREIAEVRDLLKISETVSITASVAGAGGIGKTYLAYHLAHLLRDEFPGGVFVVTLGPEAHSTDLLLARLLPEWAQVHPQGRRTDPADITPEHVRRWLADDSVRPGRVLAVLDDMWHDAPARALRDLLPPGSACLITTRNRAMSLEGKIYDLDRLSHEDACALLTDRLGDLSAYADTTDRLIGLLEGHALALEIAAANVAENGLPHLPTYTGYIADAMQTDNPLGDLTLEHGASERVKSVEAALQLSYDPLDDRLKARFRALGAFPPETDYAERSVFAVWSAKIGGADVEDAPAEKAARADLLTLFRWGLVKRVDGTPDRYRQHALLYAYARALAMRAGEQASNQAHYRDHVIADLAGQFDDLPMEQWNTTIGPDLPHIHYVGNGLADWVQDWLGDTPLESLAQPEPAAANPDVTNDAHVLLQTGETFAAAVTGYVFHRRVGEEGRRWLWLGLACARLLGNRAREGLFDSVLGSWQSQRGQPQRALDYFASRLKICRELDDKQNEATTLNNMGVVYHDLGQKQRALNLYERALPITREVGDRAGEATTLNNMGLVYDALGQKQHALEEYAQALFIMREVGDRAGEAVTLNNMASLYHDLGQPGRALDLYEQALPILREVGDRAGEATTLNNMAWIYQQQGKPERAVEIWRQVIGIAHEIGAVADEAAYMFNLAWVLHRALHQTAEAIELVTRSIALLEQYNLPQDAGGVTLEQRRAFLAQLRGEE